MECDLYKPIPGEPPPPSALGSQPYCFSEDGSTQIPSDWDAQLYLSSEAHSLLFPADILRSQMLETSLWGGTYTGTYTIKGNDITFKNLRDDNYKFINGTYYDNTLKVYLQYDRFGTTSSSTVTRLYKK